MTVSPGARRLVYAAAGLGAFAGVAGIPFAWVLATVIARVFLDAAAAHEVWPWLVTAAVIAIARAGAAWGSDALAARASALARIEVRDDLVDAVIARGPFDPATAPPGQTATTVVSGVDQLDGYIRRYLPQRLLAVVVPLAILVVVAIADPLSALVLGFTYPLIPVFMFLIGASARERSERQFVTLARLGARVLDAVQGLPTLHLFGAVARERAILADATERFRALTMEVLRLAFVSAFVLEFLATISTAVIAVQVGLRLLYGHIAFDLALFVLMLAPEFYKPLRALGAAYHAGAAGTAAWTQVQALMGAPDAESHRSSAVPHASGPPVDPCRAIDVRDLAVVLDGSRGLVLDSVSLCIRARTMTVIAGASGAGKSTLLHALVGLVRPLRGEILIDDVPLSVIGMERWRRSVGWVPQHPHLFHGTLRSNLVLGNNGVPDEVLHASLAAVGLDGWLATLPLGLETRVAERGADVSGGQMQRLAMARALAREATVLVLDEPTAHLDADAEADVLAAIDRVRQGRTVIVVAHRASVASRADAVITMADGAVVAS